MYQPAQMCIARAVSAARGTGTQGPRPEPGAVAVSTALAADTSGLRIWRGARLSARGRRAVSASMH